MVKATMPAILNTVRNIFTRLYGSVEEVRMMCLGVKNMGALVFIPPPPPNKKQQKKMFSWIWILCQNSLTRELKIRFVGLVL